MANRDWDRPDSTGPIQIPREVTVRPSSSSRTLPCATHERQVETIAQHGVEIKNMKEDTIELKKLVRENSKAVQAMQPFIVKMQIMWAILATSVVLAAKFWL